MSDSESSDFTPSDSGEETSSGSSASSGSTRSTSTYSSSYSSGSSDASSKKNNKGSARKRVGYENDPFIKRIPESFYTKEAKILGKLDSNWEVGYKGKKPYYVDHKNKTTTWVDPRTKATRVSDPQNCQMGELPYGWEEEMDEEIGVYYIDHNTQSTFLDPPWDPRVKFQVAQLSKFIKQQVSFLEEQLNDQSQEKSALDIIAEEKRELMRQIEELKRQQYDDDSDSDLSTDSELEAEEPPKTIEEFRDRLKTLMSLANLLASRPDGLAEAKQTNEEILRVQKMLEEEERVRKQLEDDIRKLKESLNQPYMMNNPYPPMPEEDSEGSPPPEGAGVGIEYDESGAPRIKRKAILSRKTKYEMGVEVMLLRKKVEEEKSRQKKLEDLKKVEEEPERDGNRPTWLKKLEAVASSKTLKVKINMKQQSGPDQLSFRERMLFFAANAANGGKK